MRCLYCGNRLAILRKLADGEFCSSSHRKLYNQEQEKMALSRLVDAQKRFSREVLGVDIENRPGSSGNEEVTGFLSHSPVVRETTPIWRPDAEPVPAFTEPAVPVRNPRIAMEPVSSMKLLPAPEPKEGELERAPEPALKPRYVLETPRPPEFLPASCAPLLPANQGCELRFPDARPPAPAGREVPIEAIQAGIAPVIPSAKCSAVSTLDLAALAISLRKLSKSRSGAAAKPAESPAPKAAQQTTQQARPQPPGQAQVQSSPQPQTQPKAKPQTQPTELPAAARRLLPVPRPSPRAGGMMLRRIRVREMFFPLPRLGDLPALAARVAKDRIRPPQYRGAIGRDKTAGGLPPAFTMEARTRDVRSGRAEFGFLAPDERHVEWRPLLSQPQAPQFPLAGKMEIGEACQMSPVPSALSHEISPEFSATAVQAPRILISIPTGHLSALSTQIDVEFSGAVGGYQASLEPVDPNIWKTADGARIPVFRFLLSPARQLSPSARMSSVAPRPDAGLVLERVPVEAMEEGAEPALRPLVPQSDPAASFAPLGIESLVHLPMLAGASPSAKSLAISELAAIWPEPTRRLPRLFTDLCEDSEVRVAVQRINALLTQNRRWRMPSLASLPSLRPDRRWAILMAPLVLLLAYYALTNQEQKTVAEATPEPAAESAGLLDGPMGNIQQTILKRAAISLSDDFRSGLGEWAGNGDWSRHWAYDPAGFIKTGPLAIFTPSIPLTDYSMEFLGQIEKKSIGWVFRAQNLNNYYATKITLVSNGPLPSAFVERFAVINGKEDRREKLVLPVPVRPDTLYRVRMELRGSAFTLLVQGRLVDHWSDERIKSGGIGFFSGKGEQARLRWVEVTHQYDFLGRLCAFLAPYSPAREGNLRP